MDEIGNSLPAVFKHQLRKPGPRLAEILEPLWARAAGRAIAQHSRPAAFADGTLKLKADSQTWAVQLGLMQAQIVSKVNEFLGAAVVKDLEVTVTADQAAKIAAGSSFRARRGEFPRRALTESSGRSGKRLD
ncbi:MAG: DUF721 domain-containing protein [Deltaproteobacteria bacterium]